MRILAVTNMLPSERRPGLGTFVEEQIGSLRNIGLEVGIISINRADRGMGAYLGLAKQIRMGVHFFQPDILHVMYGGIMADITTQTANNIPTVVTFHGSDLLGENLSGFRRKVIGRWGVWASWRAARRAERIIVVSETLRSALPTDIDNSKVKIIPCGIDLEKFKPLSRDDCCTRLGWEPKSFHILFASNGDPVKRPGLAKAAVDVACQAGADIEMHLLCGVPYRQVPLWVNASDVLLLTSLHEGSPTIVKEALACNLPVVSVEVGDVAERINGIGGCYLASPNPHDLAKKLLLVRAGLHRIEGRDRVKTLSSENVAERIAAVYSELRRPLTARTGELDFKSRRQSSALN